MSNKRFSQATTIAEPVTTNQNGSLTSQAHSTARPTTPDNNSRVSRWISENSPSTAVVPGPRYGPDDIRSPASGPLSPLRRTIRHGPSISVKSGPVDMKTNTNTVGPIPIHKPRAEQSETRANKRKGMYWGASTRTSSSHA
jgi:hypothetical protein